jgi:hypothetical protein
MKNKKCNVIAFQFKAESPLPYFESKCEEDK